jgi:hypothetical protein
MSAESTETLFPRFDFRDPELMIRNNASGKQRTAPEPDNEVCLRHEAVTTGMNA